MNLIPFLKKLNLDKMSNMIDFGVYIYQTKKETHPVELFKSQEDHK